MSEVSLSKAIHVAKFGALERDTSELDDYADLGKADLPPSATAEKGESDWPIPDFEDLEVVTRD